MSKFTPGPWFVEVTAETDAAQDYHVGGRPHIGVSSTNRMLDECPEIAVMNNNADCMNAAANAALIAAAPELLGACIELVRLAGPDGDFATNAVRVYDMACSAIAKATGGGA